MRIRLEVTVNVDDQRWGETQNVFIDGPTVAEDVRDYVAYHLDQSPAMNDTDADVTVRLLP